MQCWGAPIKVLGRMSVAGCASGTLSTATTTLLASWLPITKVSTWQWQSLFTIPYPGRLTECWFTPTFPSIFLIWELTRCLIVHLRSYGEARKNSSYFGPCCPASAGCKIIFYFFTRSSKDERSTGSNNHLSSQIFLDHRSLSSMDQKILKTPPFFNLSRSLGVVWMSSESYSSSFVLSLISFLSVFLSQYECCIYVKSP